MVLRKSRFGQFYGCTRFPECKGTHGAHPDGKPLGIPADSRTKQARIRAHAAFDELWKDGRMRRPDAYRWMQQAMGLDVDGAHIGKFTIEQCDQLVTLVQQHQEGGRV
jgi:ssDNA-binding Zn-finger/Zn-ribbon topoisomerase 1